MSRMDKRKKKSYYSIVEKKPRLRKDSGKKKDSSLSSPEIGKARRRNIYSKMKSIDPEEIRDIDYLHKGETQIRQSILRLKNKYNAEICKLHANVKNKKNKNAKNKGGKLIAQALKVMRSEDLIIDFCYDLNNSNGRFVVFIQDLINKEKEEEEVDDDDDNISTSSYDSNLSGSSATSSTIDNSHKKKQEDHIQRMRLEKEEKEREFEERMKEKRIKKGDINIDINNKKKEKKNKRKKKKKKKKKKRKKKKEKTIEEEQEESLFLDNLSEDSEEEEERPKKNVLDENFDATEDIDSLIDFINDI